MGQNAFVAQIAIRQCPHGEQCALMSTDIGIAGRPSVADIQEFSSGLWSRSIHKACRPKRSVSMAIRTFDLLLFQ